jgi:acyl-CoA dehydrogenase
MNPAHLALPFFEDGHRELASELDRWASARLGEFEHDEGNDGRVARQIFERLAQSGWLRHTLPMRGSPHVASRIDLRSICLMREISAHSSAIADVALSEPWLGILPVALYGSPALQERYIPKYLQGELLPAFALSEPDAGSDAGAIATTAHRAGEHYLINGRKTWTSNCGLADLYVVFARVTGPGEASGISAFAVDGSTDGLRLEERLSVSSPHTVGTWTLNNCRIPVDRLIGQPGEGLKIATRILELFRPTVGAAALGLARRAMTEAIGRSISRKAFGKPIAEHQLVQAKLAEMAVRVDASGLLVYRAAWLHDTGSASIAREAAIAKLYSTEAAFQVIDQAVQIFGGHGVVRGNHGRTSIQAFARIPNLRRNQRNSAIDHCKKLAEGGLSLRLAAHFLGHSR